MKLHRVDDTLSFYCPGCANQHTVHVGKSGVVWGWNGSMDFPTFTPSILIRAGHYAPGHQSKSCWCTYNAEHVDEPAPFKCEICHSFVIEGRIQFLTDSTHRLAGQTVEVPEYQ